MSMEPKLRRMAELQAVFAVEDLATDQDCLEYHGLQAEAIAVYGDLIHQLVKAGLFTMTIETSALPELEELETFASVSFEAVDVLEDGNFRLKGEATCSGATIKKNVEDN